MSVLNVLKEGRRISLSSIHKHNIWSRPAIRWHGGPKISSDAVTVPVSFISPSKASKGNQGEEITVDAKVGESLLQTAHRFSIDLEGACEGVCACSTCHVIFEDQDIFNTLPEPSEDEEDMLGESVPTVTRSKLKICRNCKTYIFHHNRYGIRVDSHFTIGVSSYCYRGNVWNESEATWCNTKLLCGRSCPPASLNHFKIYRFGWNCGSLPRYH